jgi:hypothetical protein
MHLQALGMKRHTTRKDVVFCHGSMLYLVGPGTDKDVFLHAVAWKRNGAHSGELIENESKQRERLSQ